jgi:hypothetical protein
VLSIPSSDQPIFGFQGIPKTNASASSVALLGKALLQQIHKARVEKGETAGTGTLLFRPCPGYDALSNPCLALLPVPAAASPAKWSSPSNFHFWGLHACPTRPAKQLSLARSTFVLHSVPPHSALVSRLHLKVRREIIDDFRLFLSFDLLPTPPLPLLFIPFYPLRTRIHIRNLVLFGGETFFCVDWRIEHSKGRGYQSPTTIPLTEQLDNADVERSCSVIRYIQRCLCKRSTLQPKTVR